MENDDGFAADAKIGERKSIDSQLLEPIVKGAADAEDAKAGERRAVDSQVLDPSVKETVDLSLDISICSDEDKVCEEAAEAEYSATGLEDITFTKDGHVGLNGTLGNNEGNSDDVNQDQKVNEVIVEHCAVPDTGDNLAKPLVLKSEENHAEVQIFTEDIVGGEGNKPKNDSIENWKGDGKENFDSAATDEEIEKQTDGHKMLDQSDQTPAHGMSNKLSYLEALTCGDAQVVEVDSKEEPIHQMQGSQELTQLSRAETNQEKYDTDRFEMAKIQDAKVKGGEIQADIPKSDLLDHVTLVNCEDEKCADSNSLKGHIHETEPQLEDVDAKTGNGTSHTLESESNGNTPHRIEPDSSTHAELDKRENTVANLYLDHIKDQEAGLLEDKSCSSGAVIPDDEIEGMQKLDSECVQVVKADDTSTTDCFEKNSELDTNLPPAVDTSLNLERAEIKTRSSSAETSAESSGSHQPQQVNASGDVSTTIIDRPGEESVKDEKEIILQGIRELEVRPITGAASSSSNTSMSDHGPTHSAVLQHGANLQGPVLQVSSNAEKEVKSAADVSADSACPHPSGLKHTTPPLGPPSQSKGRASISAANIPSTNVTGSTPARPAGLGRAAPLAEPSSHHVQHPRVNGAVSAAQNQLIEEPSNGETEEYDETREKLQMIRVKFLRLAHRLGQTPHNVVVAQVLYRLGLAEQLHGRSGGRVAAFSFDRASAMAEQLEAAGQEPLDFTCTIMVLGISGVGKSATINSIFDEVLFSTDAFQSGTKKVQDVVGTVQGIRVRVIDTPGLLPSWSDQRQNEKILCSVKRFIKKTPPDIVLYLDRLDMQSRDFGDMPLLRTITEIFGPSIWFNAIVVLTHAASAPPEGPNGTATSYDMFVTQRSHVVQQAIRQAAGDMRLMNPVSLVENHSACRTNRAGQRVLPNGQVWKPHLLLLSFASKILAEANTLLKLQDNPPGRPFAPRTRSPPLPFLLSSFLQSRPEVKLPSEQFGDDDDDAIDDDLDDCSDSEEESEYDELPPFKSLTKAQLEKLSKAQRKAYYDELEYREKLFMKKQLKEERRRRKMLKKMQESAKDLPADFGDNAEEETASAASVPVPMPDLMLPASFDSDNPTHRYRSLDSSNPWLVRAVLEPNGWDHDVGYDGINVERLFVVKDKVPISFSGHISKDKKDANLQMEIASSVKHGQGKATSLGFDMQSVGKDYAYTLRTETRFSNHRVNKAVAGFSATALGDVLTCGLKVEDKLTIGKRGQVIVSGGTIYGRGEVAYGGSLEATLRDKDHPLGRFLSTLGLSVMDWHGDLSIGCNTQTQIPIGRHTNLIGRLNINNRGSGQFSVRINSSEQLQIVLVGLIPLAKKLFYIVNRCSMDYDASR